MEGKPSVWKKGTDMAVGEPRRLLGCGTLMSVPTPAVSPQGTCPHPPRSSYECGRATGHLSPHVRCVMEHSVVEREVR